jgi:hypothetical protein
LKLEELLAKLAQIEEQANLTLADFPKTLTRERLRMIIALARYLRTEVAMQSVAQRDIAVDGDDTVPLRQ